jgi:L-iditol 2-dehydrogenase
VKAVVLREGGRLAVEEWARPRIGAGEILLRLRGCGLCGSDIAKLAAPPSPRPLVLGHELVGDVVEAGPGVPGIGVGDRVVAAHHVPCGACHYCRRGSASMCRAFKASHLDPGGFAEYVRVPADNVRHASFVVPPHVSDEAASFVEPLACCVRAVRRAGARPGDTAVVVGLGSVGLLFVQVLRKAGAAVVGLDPLSDRAALAKRLGAESAGGEAAAAAAARDLSEGRGADLVVVTGGGAAVLPWITGVVRDGGAIHYFAGGGGDALPLPLQTLYHRELTLTATYSSSPDDLARSFALITAGDVVVDQLVSHRLPLPRLAEAVDLVRRREALKVYLTP